VSAYLWRPGMCLDIPAPYLQQDTCWNIQARALCIIIPAVASRCKIGSPCHYECGDKRLHAANDKLSFIVPPVCPSRRFVVRVPICVWLICDCSGKVMFNFACQMLGCLKVIVVRKNRKNHAGSYTDVKRLFTGLWSRSDEHRLSKRSKSYYILKIVSITLSSADFIHRYIFSIYMRRDNLPIEEFIVITV